MFKKITKKGLLAFFISYFVVLSIPIVVSSIAYFKSEHIVEMQASDYNMAMLRQMRDVVDSRLEEVEQLAVQIASNPVVLSFLNVDANMTEKDRYEATQVIKSLQSYRNGNSFVDDFFIYYKNSDCIFSANSKYPARFFYENLYSVKDMPYEQWRDQTLTRYYYADYRSNVHAVIDNLWNKSMLTYVYSVPLGRRLTFSAALVILINNEKIEQLLANIVPGGLAYVIDKNNCIIAASDNKIEHMSLPDYGFFGDVEALKYNTIDGEEMAISYVSSNRNGWKYVSLTPRYVLMEKVNTIKRMTMIVFMISLGIGSLAAYILARKSYAPIYRLISSISSWMEKPLPCNMNELDFIEDVTVSALKNNKELEKKYGQAKKENEQFKEEINKNRLILKSGFLFKLLNGGIDNYENIEDTLALYDIDFPYEMYGVILFEMKNFKTGDEQNKKAQWLSVRISLMDDIEKSVNNYGKGYAVEVECDRLALIVNIHDKLKHGNIADVLREIARTTIDIVYDNYKFKVNAGISRCYSELKYMYAAYSEATKALDYKIISADNAIILYDETLKDKNYYYPIDVELQLINHIKAGDISDVSALLEMIFYENFKKKRLSLEAGRCIFFDIIGTALKILEEIKIDYTEIFASNVEPIDMLLQCQTIDEIFDTLKKIYGGICDYINKHKRSHNVRLKVKILEYIKQHYMEDGLSQTVVAEALKINPSYLSRFFKQEFGQSMVDFINRIRVDEAKRLLADPSLSLSDIAKRIGCNSDMTLIRIFKKFEGVTPGKYRDSLSINTRY